MENELISVNAKFFVSEKAETSWQGQKPPRGIRIVMAPTSANGQAENDAFAKASPSGKLEMVIMNPPAAAFFEPGAEYYLTFTKVPAAAPAS
jgi:hypothetical protein